ncbi:TPA: hypothetical protein N0F65_001720 [Lagenidium giganteum]|uniref:Centriolar satellite-associated tubulin polyglutamylase complex regulator 1 n=1 Tax=Lagenidium giganteum TaxID=4803 RepID=A0AAV2Z6L4_9STRA|nr:TPA: hypothetical protein N0F65_001720 [Lagenidium giganteum]
MEAPGSAPRRPVRSLSSASLKLSGEAPPDTERALEPSTSNANTSATNNNCFAQTEGISRLRAERVIAAACRLPLDPTTAKPDDSNNNSSNNNGSSAGSSMGKSRMTAALGREHYLFQTGVQFFLEDLVRRLQDEKPDHPAHYIANYFASVMRGDHIRNRGFEYVNGCLQNRVAFVTHLERTFSDVDPTMQLSQEDFAELIHFQCRDVPQQLLQQACYHLKPTETGPGTDSLKSLLGAFVCCFFYNGAELKSNCAVVLETTERRACDRIANAMTADRVVARLHVVAQQNRFGLSLQSRLAHAPSSW